MAVLKLSEEIEVFKHAERQKRMSITDERWNDTQMEKDW